METQAMSVRFPKDLYEQLRRAAFDERVPMNEVIVEAVTLGLALSVTTLILRHALDVSLQLNRTPAHKVRIVKVQNRLTSWSAFRACENGRPTVSELREAIGDATDRSVEAALSKWESGEGAAQ
jgi:hypothetical protein